MGGGGRGGSWVGGGGVAGRGAGGGDVRVGVNGEQRGSQGGGGGKVWVEQAKMLVMGELDLQRHDVAGGVAYNQLVSFAGLTFFPIKGLMAGMAAVMVIWMTRDPAAMEPTSAHFWFVMSIALSAGFVVAYPINWWLVDRGLKHGMMTGRPEGAPIPLAARLVMAGDALGGGHPEVTKPQTPGQMAHEMKPATSTPDLVRMIAVSLVVLAVGIAIASVFGDLTMSAGSMAAGQ